MSALHEAAQQALEAWNTGDLRVLGPAMGALRAALAQKQAEPVAWVASRDGRVIYDAVSTDDVLLRVSGDFETDEQRIRYTQQIVDALNAAPPRRTMVPLTEEEIVEAVREADLDWQAGWTLDEHAPNRFDALARAIEKASWEKNHGQA